MRIKRITPTRLVIMNDKGEVHRTLFTTRAKALASIERIAAGLVAFDSIGVYIPPKKENQ